MKYLPEWLQNLIRPELDHLIADFTKLDRKLGLLLQRHHADLAGLHDEKRTLETNIAGKEHEISRTLRVAAKISDLVN